MPLRKINTEETKRQEFPCMHPEHNPTNMIVLEPGQYEYSCPSCGDVYIFTVPAKFCLSV